MNERAKKITLLITFPIMGLGLIALLVFIFAEIFVFKAPDKYAYPLGSDVLGFAADWSAKIEVEYTTFWYEKPARSFNPESTAIIKISGPADGIFRFLIPQDAMVLAKAPSSEETFKDLHAFTTAISLPAGSVKILKFRYKLPAITSAYSLTLLPGGNKVMYKVKSTFPDSAVLSSKTFKVNKTELSFSGAPIGPELLKATLEYLDSPVTFTGGKIIAPNQIELNFKRQLSQIISTDGVDFSVADLNVKNGEITDRVFIGAIKVSGNSIFISTRGMTLQRGESYKITGNNIKDTNGNILEPNPLITTLTQPGGSF
ncbi:hypothetical protein HZA42_04990 [Candidatus Peregrinibacteria bacterium]|nr:hypothetical protein [Candidatus Peregrinibacteria bacterium]